jgi:integrase
MSPPAFTITVPLGLRSATSSCGPPDRVAALRFFLVETLKRYQFREFLPYPRDRRRLPTVLSQEEVSQLINGAGNLFRLTLLTTLYGTGMRRAELARLKFGDVDSQWMIIPVVEGKGGKDRDLPLSPALLETLREYWRWRKPKLYMFPTRTRGRTLDQPISDKTVWIACSEAAHRAGIRKRVTPQTLRHYLPFLTMSSEMGEPGSRSIITACNSNRVDQSLDIVFSVFSALQIIEEAKQLVSRLVAPRSAVRR